MGLDVLPSRNRSPDLMSRFLYYFLWHPGKLLPAARYPRCTGVDPAITGEPPEERPAADPAAGPLEPDGYRPGAAGQPTAASGIGGKRGWARVPRRFAPVGRWGKNTQG